jgi:segregation and condensation protein A
MSYAVATECFEGPFDLLLQLVESNELEITDISLVQVTEPFLRLLDEHRGRLLPEDLADFLVIAAKLVYLKSRALIPGLQDAEMDDGPDLASQLRVYQTFIKAARHIQLLAAGGARSFARESQPRKVLPGVFQAPVLMPKDLFESFKHVVGRLEPLRHLPQAAVERIMTLEEKMAELVERVARQFSTSFRDIVKHARSRAEFIVTFLAVLELIKRRSITVQQGGLFDHIAINKL